MRYTHFQRSILTAICIVMLGCLTLGCHLGVPTTNGDLAAAEVAIRHVLTSGHDGQLIFLGFRSPSGKDVDPPAGFISRFSDLSKPVKPVSASYYDPYDPTRVDGRIAGLHDRDSQMKGWLLSARIVAFTPNTMKIEVDSTGGVMSGMMVEVTVRKDSHGRWQLGSVRRTAIH